MSEEGAATRGNSRKVVKGEVMGRMIITLFSGKKECHLDCSQGLFDRTSEKDRKKVITSQCLEVAA
jgi:hypothetical protein